MVSVGMAVEEAASVRLADPAEVPALAKALAAAFHDDPAFTWVLHGEPRRATLLERGFELFLRRVWMEQRLTYTTDTVAGVAGGGLAGQGKPELGLHARPLPARARN